MEILPSSELRKLDQEATLVTCMRRVTGSSLVNDTDYPG
jgi:hypothetical protein